MYKEFPTKTIRKIYHIHLKNRITTQNKPKSQQHKYLLSRSNSFFYLCTIHSACKIFQFKQNTNKTYLLFSFMQVSFKHDENHCIWQQHKTKIVIALLEIRSALDMWNPLHKCNQVCFCTYSRPHVSFY